ncbi:MAG: DUF4142 domain-containing protein [Kofleriaceae bacterium]
MRARLLIVCIATAVLASSGCKKKEQAAPPPPPPTTPTPTEGSAAGGSAAGSADPSAAAPAAPAFNDAQIAAIVVAANQVDIDAGQLAAKKSKNADVKKFANQMVTDHTAVNKAATELVTKLKVTPEESDTSKSLTSSGAETRAKLEKLSGAEFDKAYVDNEVAYHEAVIDVLKTKLIPSATNQELKNELIGVQPAFDAHLQHAKQIQAALGGGAKSDAHDHK